VNGVLIASLYAPNGNPPPGPKFTYKLAWMDRLAAHAAYLFAAGVPVVLAGDFNVVPTDRGIYPTKSYVDNALAQPESRTRFAQLLGQGLISGTFLLSDQKLRFFVSCLHPGIHHCPLREPVQPSKRLIELAQGTHSVMMETHRFTLFDAVQKFFDKGEGSPEPGDKKVPTARRQRPRAAKRDQGIVRRQHAHENLRTA